MLIQSYGTKKSKIIEFFSFFANLEYLLWFTMSEIVGKSERMVRMRKKFMIFMMSLIGTFSIGYAYASFVQGL